MVKPPKATPPNTGTGAPMLVFPSWNWTVPVASWGATFAMGITKPPKPKGRGTRITPSQVFVTCAPGAGVVGGGDVGVGVGDTGVGVGDTGVGVGDTGVGVGDTGVGVGDTGVGVGDIVVPVL